MKKTLMKWNWISFILFFGLSIIDFRFGIIALACPMIAMVLAHTKRKKEFCSYYCPRGSFLGQLFKKISFGLITPSFMKRKSFKIVVMIFMLGNLGVSLYLAGTDLNAMGYALFRFVATSTVVAVTLATLFKPRTWCTICPLGTATGLYVEQRGGTKNNAEKIKIKKYKKSA